MTHGAPKPSQRVRSHGTRDGVGALPIRGGGGSGAPGHVTVSEPTSTGRHVLVLRDTWQSVVARARSLS
jgi:hypothetical protein